MPDETLKGYEGPDETPTGYEGPEDITKMDGTYTSRRDGAKARPRRGERGRTLDVGCLALLLPVNLKKNAPTATPTERASNPPRITNPQTMRDYSYI